jgi:prepilin-type N-terminal cleavage/methylation domain-containing protein
MERDPLLSPRTRRRRQGGFTLVELLVTMLVTTVALAGLFGVFASTTRGNIDAREAAEALALCESSTDVLKSYTVAQLEADLGYPAVVTGATWGPIQFHEGDVTGATGVVFERQVWGRGIDDDLVWFKIAIVWASDGAVLGSEGGIHDHEIALEIVRSRTEAAPP